MATAEQVKALILSHAESDDSRFYTIALQVAAQEARNGHTKIAQDIKALIDKAQTTPKKPTPLVQPRGDLAALLSASYPNLRLSSICLNPSLSERVERILREQRQQERLKAHGLSPLRKLLFVGSPGVGKTMTAAVLAGELHLPLFTIQLDGLISRFMGETSAKLRLIFDAVQQTRGVYLFDEFDSFGGERNSSNDVGEIRRVLSSFLSFLEQDTSDSLLVAATNHPGLLDKALFRRFDSILEYTLPTPEEKLKLIRSRLAFVDTKNLDWQAAVEATNELSHADIVKACERAAKDVILEEMPSLTTEALVTSLRERQRG
jgi:SpoVK/Ycf46/Vps4 family AAA+-type ATPase